MNMVKRLDELGREEGRVYDVDRLETERVEMQSREQRVRELDEYFRTKKAIDKVDSIVGLPGRFARWCGRQADNVVDYAFVAAACVVGAVYPDRRQLGTNDFDNE